MSSIKFTQLPTASTPLGGNEILALVQSGTSKQATVDDLADFLAFAALSGEAEIVAAAGNNNNTVVGDVNAALFDTTAGAATITGIVAGSAGQLLLITNQGPNNLTMAVEAVASTAANRLYGVVDVTMFPKQSMLLSYSSVLARWKTV